MRKRKIKIEKRRLVGQTNICKYKRLFVEQTLCYHKSGEPTEFDRDMNASVTVERVACDKKGEGSAVFIYLVNNRRGTVRTMGPSGI